MLALNLRPAALYLCGHGQLPESLCASSTNGGDKAHPHSTGLCTQGPSGGRFLKWRSHTVLTLTTRSATRKSGQSKRAGEKSVQGGARSFTTGSEGDAACLAQTSCGRGVGTESRQPDSRRHVALGLGRPGFKSQFLPGPHSLHG